MRRSSSTSCCSTSCLGARRWGHTEGRDEQRVWDSDFSQVPERSREPANRSNTFSSGTASRLRHARELKAKGAYGACEDCGQKIAPERLEVLPESSPLRCLPGVWEATNPR